MAAPIAFLAVSMPEAAAFLVVSIILDAEEVSEEVDTEVESAVVAVFLELQAATDIVIAKAKKPNLNEFFIFMNFFEQ